MMLLCPGLIGLVVALMSGRFSRCSKNRNRRRQAHALVFTTTWLHARPRSAPIGCGRAARFTPGQKKPAGDRLLPRESHRCHYEASLDHVHLAIEAASSIVLSQCGPGKALCRWIGSRRCGWRKSGKPVRVARNKVDHLPRPVTTLPLHRIRWNSVSRKFFRVSPPREGIESLMKRRAGPCFRRKRTCPAPDQLNWTQTESR